MRKLVTLPLCISLMLAPSLYANNVLKLDKHSHGEVIVNLNKVHSQLKIVIESPGQDVVGFEGSPITSKEITAFSEALNKFRQSKKLFRLNSEAQCKLKNQRLVHSISPDNKATKEHIHAADETFKQRHGADEEEHSAFVIHYTYQCKKIDKLDDISITWFNVFPKTRLIKVNSTNQKRQRVQRMIKQPSLVTLR